TETLATRTPFPDLVTQIRNGPPALSFFRIHGVDERANLVEYFVHHEDVRRAADGWEPRGVKDGLADALWQRLRMGRILFRRAPVGVELVRDDLAAGPGQQPGRMTAKAKTPVVTGPAHPATMRLWALGRPRAAHVRLHRT